MDNTGISADDTSLPQRSCFICVRFGKRPWEGGLVSTAGHQPLIGALEPTERCSITCWRRILMHSSRLGLVVSTSALALMLSTAPIAPSQTGWLSSTAAL